jgi:rhodanese-related sulfurtransferase
MKSEKIVIIGLLLLFFWTCSGQVRSGAYKAMLKTLLSHTVPEVSVSQVIQDSAVTFLDAREPNEFAVSHLSSAHYVGYDHFDMKSVESIPKDERIVVYCSVGYRSEKVAEQLIAAGYKNVSNLYGGIFEWVNEGQSVVDATGPTERVHAFNRKWGIWLKKGKKVY